MKQNPLDSMYHKVVKDVQQGLSRYMEEVMKGIIDPAEMGRFAGQSGADPYRVLGLDRSASDEEVKRRFRELARVLHPDTSGGEGTEFLFKLVNLSYEQISRERGWK